MRAVTLIRAAVLGAVMLIAAAAPAAAGTFPSGYYGFGCSDSGGALGYGYVKARGQIRESGLSGANYLVIKAL